MKNQTRTKRFFSTILAAVMAVMMLAGVPVMADSTTVTFKMPTGSDVTNLSGMKIDAYQVLTEKSLVDDLKVYEVHEAFKNFFGASVPNVEGDNIYITFENNVLSYSATQPSGDYITLTNDLDETYFAADIISRLEEDADDIRLMAEWLRKYVSANSDKTYSHVESTAAENATEISLTFETAGYYVILSSNVPFGITNVRTIAKLVPGKNIEATLKADSQVIDKEVTNDKALEAAAVGSVLPYAVTTKLPALENYNQTDSDGNVIDYKYTIGDTMTNQELVEYESSSKPTFKVTINYGEGNIEDEGYEDYVVYVYPDNSNPEYKNLTDILKTNGVTIGNYADTQQSFSLAFDISKLRDVTDEEGNHPLRNGISTVKVEYSTKLNSDAVTIANNKAVLDYNNDPYSETPKNEETETKVYLYGIDVTKIFSSDGGNFSDVKFELYSDTALENAVNFTANYDENDATKLVGYTASAEKIEGSTTTELSLTSDGHLILNGLAAGTYYLKETSTSSDYKTAGTITVVIAEEVVTETKTGAIDSANSSAKEGTTDLKATVETTYEKDDKGNNTNTVESSVLKFEILNQKGFTLPGTGGMGTYIFTIGGVLLIAAAVLYFTSLKKRNNE